MKVDGNVKGKDITVVEDLTVAGYLFATGDVDVAGTIICNNHFYCGYGTAQAKRMNVRGALITSSLTCQESATAYTSNIKSVQRAPMALAFKNKVIAITLLGLAKIFL